MSNRGGEVDVGWEACQGRGGGEEGISWGGGERRGAGEERPRVSAKAWAGGAAVCSHRVFFIGARRCEWGWCDSNSRQGFNSREGGRGRRQESEEGRVFKSILDRYIRLTRTPGRKE